VLPDGWQLIVTGVTPDAWAGIHAADASARAPASDQRDVMLRLEATYRGDSSGVFTTGRLVLVSTASGTRYDQITNNCGVIPDAPGAAVLTAGGVVRGNVCFTVRASDVDSLVLFDSQSSPNQQLYFSLH